MTYPLVISSSHGTWVIIGEVIYLKLNHKPPRWAVSRRQVSARHIGPRWQRIAGMEDVDDIVGCGLPKNLWHVSKNQEQHIDINYIYTHVLYTLLCIYIIYIYIILYIYYIYIIYIYMQSIVHDMWFSSTLLAPWDPTADLSSHWNDIVTVKATGKKHRFDREKKQGIWNVGFS